MSLSRVRKTRRQVEIGRSPFSSPAYASNIASISDGRPGSTQTLLDHEPGRAALRVPERPAAGRQLRPARGVVRVLREALAQLVGELRHLDLA